ncbi:MAG: hypothetical protein AAGG48_10710 [Planctomycetota bacterium]
MARTIIHPPKNILAYPIQQIVDANDSGWIVAALMSVPTNNKQIPPTHKLMRTPFDLRIREVDGDGVLLVG